MQQASPNTVASGQPADSIVVRARDLTKIYDTGAVSVHALKAVDLDIQTGEFCAVVGPSGSGKSTLMHLIGCLDSPTSGQYWIDGTEVATLDDDALSAIRNHHIGFIFQSFNLIAQLDLVANVELPLIYANQHKNQRRHLALSLLEKVGLADRSHHRPNQLSGGQMQRVAIARALVNDPSLILADEPTGNLDSKTSTEIMELLTNLHAEGKTLVIVTHDPRVAGQAERVIHMGDGVIQWEGTGREYSQAFPAGVLLD
ncbi:MAG: ABC transporter ATP-binding protein [Verrucomicrobiota bacterium]|jgi:putative ABC transport system ATP-binding protein|nr:ABC transporter ATP-binding protein [Verrucomicrobiota bacterium]MDD8045982.1 ABC transporter ATP-binding protein [Verrucomicrobiota bacterium]MDI9383096.1 ABC transporter ATP-binding protein [Verrucomicrobiota bacterium]HCF94679.1 macrolide ABC transporter ATP-binding protein [Verrucomicrobiota bacterium]